ncbi:unnamed protein product [Musa textilis]
MPRGVDVFASLCLILDLRLMLKIIVCLPCNQGKQKEYVDHPVQSPLGHLKLWSLRCSEKIHDGQELLKSLSMPDAGHLQSSQTVRLKSDIVSAYNGSFWNGRLV